MSVKFYNSKELQSQIEELNDIITDSFGEKKGNCQAKNGIIVENISSFEDQETNYISCDEDNNQIISDEEEIEDNCDCNTLDINKGIELKGKIRFNVPLCFMHINVKKLKKYIASRISKALVIEKNRINFLKINNIENQQIILDKNSDSDEKIEYNSSTNGMKKGTEVIWNMYLNDYEICELITKFPNPIYDSSNFIMSIHGLLYLISKSFKDFPRQDIVGNNLEFYINKFNNYEEINNIFVSICV